MLHRFVLRDRARSEASACETWVLRAPVLTEKTFQRMAEHPVFYVDTRANAFDVKKAVESIFQVGVKAVRLLTLKGKVKRFKGRQGTRQDRKKAYVDLVQGARLDLEEWSRRHES